MNNNRLRDLATGAVLGAGTLLALLSRPYEVEVPRGQAVRRSDTGTIYPRRKRVKVDVGQLTAKTVK